MPSYPVLIPLTDATRTALDGRHEVAIDRLPFRIGRESRKGIMDGIQFYLERRKDEAAPSNDLYLNDAGNLLHISRRHLEIDVNDDGEVRIHDLDSRCGTLVDGTAIGGKDQAGSLALSRGSEIVLGTPESPYRFTIYYLERFVNLTRRTAGTSPR